MTIPRRIQTFLIFWALFLGTPFAATAFCPLPPGHDSASVSSLNLSSPSSSSEKKAAATSATSTKEELEIFERFADFLQEKQTEIISQLEEMDGSGQTFTRDTWGIFENMDNYNNNDEEEEGEEEFELPSIGAGGITRVIQGGKVVEKGACSLTIIQNGVLSPERAAAIRARQPKEEEEEGEEEEEEEEDDDFLIGAGDFYSAAALSIVLHSRNPMVPTFRSDVRIFLVQDASSKEKKRPVMAWFGGGADLTPYYLFDEDITFFHKYYKENCCDKYGQDYEEMKQDCDEYFYLPARAEHRGTGGIFFDDMEADEDHVFDFVQSVANAWMPSWLPIVKKRQPMRYTDKQKQWQKLRRGRYLEFNLLYDRGVKFGLQTANPRVEGVMVSAPPEIAFEYNHVVEKGSEEERLVKILKEPIDWANKE